MRPYGWRDGVVATICNALLRLASRRFREDVHRVIDAGVRAVFVPSNAPFTEPMDDAEGDAG